MHIQNVDYFQLSDLLRDFYCLTNISISFWNSNGEKCLMAPDRDNSPFCRELRKIPELDEQCRKCDRAALSAVNSKNSTLYQFRCHAGMNEYVMPVFFNDYLIGYFMFGQVRNHTTDLEGAESREKLYHDYSLNQNLMSELYLRLPCVDDEKMQAAGRILVALVGYAHLNGLVWNQDIPMVQKIDHYIQRNFMNNLNIDLVCRELHIARSTLSHTLQKSMHTSFINLVKKYRVENVCRCLDNHQNIMDAAFNSGFQSVSYMTRVFKELKGITPSQYQNDVQLRKKQASSDSLPVILVDRDGTMGDGPWEMLSPQNYTMFPETKQAFDLLKKYGFPVYIISNQACIARGLDHGYNFAAEFSALGADDWFICPHDAKDNCSCRKPKPGLIYQARDKYHFSLENAYTIGDRWSDMVAGGTAGTHLILVKTGRGHEAMSEDRAKWAGYHADYIASDILDAAKWLVKKHCNVD